MALLTASAAACGAPTDGDHQLDPRVEAPSIAAGQILESQRATRRDLAHADATARHVARVEAEHASEVERLARVKSKRFTKLLRRRHRSTSAAIGAVVGSAHRSRAHVARDAQRNPAQSLANFGLRLDDRVVQFGGDSYYTELLAPLVHRRGKLTVVDSPTTHKAPARELELTLSRVPLVYGKVARRSEDAETRPSSADLVIATDICDDWQREGRLNEQLAQSFNLLRAGGRLALRQALAPAGTNAGQAAQTGRLPEATLVRAAQSAGFRLSGRSVTGEASTQAHADPSLFAADGSDIPGDASVELSFVKPKSNV